MGGGSEYPSAIRSAQGGGDREQIPTASWKLNLWGLVDMGSNGIRLSITDMASPRTRVLPTLYTYRNKLSLYEAQYDDDGNKIPLSAEVIDDVIAMLLRFQVFCSDFSVPPFQIRVLATEATRNAINSDELLRKILDVTGLKVEILSQSDEGSIGAWGVASSSHTLRGLVMDLGGGSTQITWMVTKNGMMRTSPIGAVSFPYGAAALTKKLKDLEKGKTKDEAEKARAEFRAEVKSNFQKAYEDLKLPHELVKDAETHGGFPIYLTGGGFRGWGYLLLHQSQVHGNKYPISIINGFTAYKDKFTDADALKKVAKQADKIFRVSDRRRGQVPAVAFLVNILAEAIPNGIKEAHFCQGGVREGVLFSSLPPEIRAQDPLEVATSHFARPLAVQLAQYLHDALPPTQAVPSSKRTLRSPKSIDGSIIRATANMFYYHSNMSKELASTSALYSTSTGLLASTHGISHLDRALLALILEARYEGELAPRDADYRSRLRMLLTNEEVWWTMFIGRVALVLSRAFPAGIAEDGVSKGPAPKKPKIEVSSEWIVDAKAAGGHDDSVSLKLTFGLRWRRKNHEDPMQLREALEGHVKEIIKVGKEKHAINGWWLPVDVVVEDLNPVDE